ncbi:MAG: hypothetical protein M1816_002438 [Peltula sp. TS41687]|nr:MAG: hypothetical protein M1816_002438 [Peltula sp. TS41687]
MGPRYSRPPIETDDSSTISLQQLEPSSVDDDLPYNNNYFPSSSPPSTTKPLPAPDSHTNTHAHPLPIPLGLHSHSPTYYLTRLQKYSSWATTFFLSLHIANNSLIPLATRSIPASEPYLLLTRPYYQSHPLIEPLVIILPFTTHIVAGIALRIYRRVHLSRLYGADSRLDRRRLAWPALSGTSLAGYALLPFFAAHVAVNRILPYCVDGGNESIGLAYVAHGFARFPALSFVAYVGLVGAASVHFVWGWARWLGGPSREDGAWRRKWRWYGLNVLSAGLAGLWLAGGLGVVGRGGAVEGWVGRGYDELFRRIPGVGRWL